MPDEVFIAFDDGSLRSFRDGVETFPQPWMPRNDAVGILASPSGRVLYVETGDGRIAKIDVASSTVVRTSGFLNTWNLFVSPDGATLLGLWRPVQHGAANYHVLSANDLTVMRTHLGQHLTDFVFSGRTGITYGRSMGRFVSPSESYYTSHFHMIDIETMRSVGSLRTPLPVRTHFTGSAIIVADSRLGAPENQCDVAVIDFDFPGQIRAWLYNERGMLLRHSHGLNVTGRLSFAVGGDPARIFVGCGSGVAFTSFRHGGNDTWSSFVNPGSGPVLGLACSNEGLYVMFRDALIKLSHELTDPLTIATFSAYPYQVEATRAISWFSGQVATLHRALAEFYNELRAVGLARKVIPGSLKTLNVLESYAYLDATGKSENKIAREFVSQFGDDDRIGFEEIHKYLLKFVDDPDVAHQFLELFLESRVASAVPSAKD